MCQKDKHFEKIVCDTCGGTEDLCMARYSERVRCLECVNKQLKESEDESRSN
jgi:ribosomal protein S27E